MKMQYRKMIQFALIGLTLLTFIYFGYSMFVLQDDKFDQLKNAFDDETAKNQALREEVAALKLENDKVQTYIEQASQFHLDEMDQLMTSNDRKIGQMRELISHLSDIEVRHGKILSYTQTDQLALEVDFEGETVEGYTQMVQVSEETSVFLIDVIGPIRAEQANLLELLDSALTAPIPHYEQFTFVFVNGKLIQIYQGQSELSFDS
jgi:hypothetical protein